MIVKNYINIFILLISSVAAFYSVGYHNSNEDHEIKNAGLMFKDAPTAEHVADIYCRLSGLPPILSEDEIMLPTVTAASGQVSKPVILTVDGGVLPRSVASVVGSSAFPEGSSAPSADEVINILNNNGIEVELISMTARGDRSQEVANWIGKQQRPIVVLHKESPASYHFVRSLAESGNTTYAELSEFEISQYQICLWAAVIFVFIALASVCSIANMEVIPDSLLYAKFQSGRTGNRID